MSGCLDLEHAERETKRGKRKIYDARGAQYIDWLSYYNAYANFDIR